MLDIVSREREDKLQSLAALIGNTPLIRILARCEGQNDTVYAKAVTIFMPDWVSVERRALLAVYGADVRLVSSDDGGFLGCMTAAEHCAQQGAYLPRQFSNPVNADEHAEGTGPELWQQVAAGGFVAGVGTGGTVMGIGRYLKGRDPSITVHPVEPIESPTLSVGHKCGQHRVQGLSDEFIPAILNLAELDGVIGVHDGDAIMMAQQLIRQLGLGVGISSGINLVAAIRLALQQPRAADGSRKAVATIFADSNSKYLSTDLARTEPCCGDYWTPGIDLLDMRIIR